MDGQISLDEYLSTGWPAVISATDTVVTMVGKAWDLVLSNPLARVYVAGGLLAVGIGFLVALRRSSRR